MKKILLSLFAVCVMLAANAQAYQWASQIEGTSHDQSLSVSSIGTDIYSTGSFTSSTDLDPSSGTLSFTSNGDHDVYIQKLDENGNFLWGKTVGGTGNDFGRMINDYGTHIIISGTFQDSVDFNPGTPTHFKTSNGGYDVFVLALDANGDFLWVNTFGGTGNDAFGGQEKDGNDDLVITGGFTYDMTVDVAGTPTTITSASGDKTDVFFMKIDLSGNLSWISSIGGTGINAGRGVAIKANNHMLFSGRYRNIMDANPGTGTFSLSSVGGYSIYLLELDTQGDFVNAFSIDNAADMETYDMELDANENIYLTGFYKGTADFDMKSGMDSRTSNGDQDSYVVKYTPNKDLVWAKTFGSSGLEQSLGVEVSANGDVYTVGRYSDVTDFDPNTGVVNHTAVGPSYDMYFHKLDSTGNFEWVHTYGNIDNDIARGLEIDPDGNVYVSGSFAYDIDFDPTTGIDSLVTDGSRDAVLLKFSDVSVGVNDIAPQNKTAIKIYPNPVQNQLFFELDNEEITGITIIDFSGRVVQSIANTTAQSVNVSNLVRGIYVLRISTKNGMRTNRFIKQ